MAIIPTPVDCGVPAQVADLLAERVRRQGDAPAYTFLRGSEVADAMTWRELQARAGAVASALRQNATPGDRALLVYPPGLDFIAAFLGSLSAGVVAIPVNPPRNERSAGRLESIVANAQPRFLLTTSRADSGTLAILSKPRWTELTRLDTDLLPPLIPETRGNFTISAHPLAYLQYTSGSTETPRGVMITHANVMANLRFLHHAMKQQAGSATVVWLPHFHDMGLLHQLYALSVGMHCVVQSPAQFASDPLSWVQAMSRYRATWAGAPNFAYQLCADRLPATRQADLDLSSWRFAYCGAEPVRRSTLEQFASAFAPYGFSLNWFYPCYGLAESTVAVTMDRPAGEPRFLSVRTRGLQAGRIEATESRLEADVTDLVSCGLSSPGHRFAIVDPETGVERAEREIGEIWATGPSVSAGYWQRPDATAAVFGNHLATGQGPYVRTGDLGFVDEGQLYITGRLKELIILRGRNHYPQDIEATVQRSHPALRKDGGAAFSLTVDGEECLGVVQEIKREMRHDLPVEEIIAAVQNELALCHEISAHVIVLVSPASVPKTSSGKIQRRLCRELYQTGGLKVLASWSAPRAPSTPSPVLDQMVWTDDVGQNSTIIHDWLLSWFRQHKGLDVVVEKQPVNELGVDSVTVAELHRDLESWLGRRLPITAFWEHATLELLVARIAQPAADRSSLAGETRPLDGADQLLEAVEQLTGEEVSRQLQSRRRDARDRP